MGTYNSAVITNGGQSMIAQSVAGASLEFTTIKTSDYTYPAGTNLAALTTINSIKQTKDITGATVYNSRVIKVSAAVDNTGLSTAYAINTIGIYAKVGSAAETLFAVVTASAADTMPAYSNKPYSYIYEVNLTMQNAANVTVTVNSAGLVNVSDLNAAKVEIRGEIDDLKSEITQKKTVAIPCSFSPATGKIDLSLSGYSGKKVFVSNRNLLPQFPQMTDHGITCTRNADGSITLSGTADGVASIRLSVNVMPNLGAGTYALSAGNTVAIGDNNTWIRPSIDDYETDICAYLNTVDGKTTFTISEGSSLTGIRIRIPSGVVIPDGYKLYPQITEGTEYLEFVPHDGTVLSPTSGTISNVDAYTDYTYVCAQSGVSGTVTFDSSVIGNMQAEVDALDVRVTALEAKSGKFAGKKIVCFGDSITGNFPAPIDYPSMIAEITGATVYNAGFGGCCMSDNDQPRKDFTMCRLTDSIVAGNFSAQRNSGVSITYAGTSIDYVPERLTMLEGIDWSEIDYITIAYGTNDWNSNYELDNPSNPLDTTTYIGAFRYSVENLLAAYPNIKIMVITPLWRWWDTNTGMPSEIHADYIDSDDYAKGTGYKLWQYGDALVEAAKWYHIPVFDLYWNCMMTKQNRFEYFNATDGTHPKLEGRELMAGLISAHMEYVY